MDSSPLIIFLRMGLEKNFLSILDDLSKAILRLSCKHYSQALPPVVITMDLLMHHADRNLLLKSNRPTKDYRLSEIGNLDLLLFFADAIKENGKFMYKIMERATHKGDIEMMTTLHDWGCEMLHLGGAIKSGNVEALKLLFNWGARIQNVGDPPVQNMLRVADDTYHLVTAAHALLRAAIEAKNVEMVRFLLDHGCKPDRYPARMAVLSHPILLLLHERGCPIDGNTIRAVISDFKAKNNITFKQLVEILKLLIDWCGKVEIESFASAVACANIEVVTFLKENYPIPPSHTYMQQALMGHNRDLELVRLVHEWFPNDWKRSYETFNCAVFTGNAEVVRFLHEQGCPIATELKDAPKTVEMAELLHSLGVRFTDAILTRSLWFKNIEVVKLIHSYGAGFEPNGEPFSAAISTFDKSAPSEKAAKTELVKLLFTWNCPIGNPFSVLEAAAKDYNDEILCMLLDEHKVGDNLDEPSKQRIFTTACGSTATIQMLYDRGFRWPDNGSALEETLYRMWAYKDEPRNPLNLLLDLGHPLIFDIPEASVFYQVFMKFPGTSRLAEMLFKAGKTPPSEVLARLYQVDDFPSLLPAFLLMKKCGIEDNGIVLREAARLGDQDFMNSLLDAGFKWDKEGTTLCNAIKSKQLGAVKSLVERGCVIDSTAIQAAESSGTDAIKSFLQHKHGIDSGDNKEAGQ